jgi:hypothetical protein
MKAGMSLGIAFASMLGIGLGGEVAKAQGVSSTKFRVVDKTGGKLGFQKILVFLTPENNAEDFVYTAWQQLNPGENSTQSFVLNQAVGGQVVTLDGKQETEVVATPPGYMATVTNAQELGIALGKATLTLPETSGMRVTPSQSGIINGTATPPLATKVRWYVNGNMTAESRTFLPSGRALSTFELKTKLYWTVGTTVKAPSFTYQQIDPLVTYALPPNTPSVDVVVSFDEAAQTFKFDFTAGPKP